MIDDGVVRDDDRREDHARGEVSLRTERHNKNRLEGGGRAKRQRESARAFASRGPGPAHPRPRVRACPGALAKLLCLLLRVSSNECGIEKIVVC